MIKKTLIASLISSMAIGSSVAFAANRALPQAAASATGLTFTAPTLSTGRSLTDLPFEINIFNSTPASFGHGVILNAIESDTNHAATITITSNTCPDPFTPGSSCSVTGTINMPEVGIYQFGLDARYGGESHHILNCIQDRNCLTIESTLSNFAYIANNGNNTVTSCAISTDAVTIGSLSACHVTATGLSFGPAGISINQDGSLAYVSLSNASGAIDIYPLTATGEFGPLFAEVPGFINPVALKYNSANESVYIASNSGAANNITYCNGLLDSCTPAIDTQFNNPYGIDITPDGKFAFLSSTNDTGGAFSCLINETTGAFDSCSLQYTTPLDPYGIAVHPVMPYVYVVSSSAASPHDSTISVCTGNVDTGELSDCVETGDFSFGSADPFLWGISVNPAGTFAYITDNDHNETYICPIDQTDGTLGVCNLADTLTGDLSAPQGIAVQ